MLLNPKTVASDEISNYIAFVSTYSPSYNSYYPILRNIFSLFQNQSSTGYAIKDSFKVFYKSFKVCKSFTI